MILLDTNIVLDVIQKRQPHYQASATVLDRIVRRQIAAALPAHAMTTVHFIVHRYQDQATASKVIGWLLDWFNVAAVGKAELMRAHTLGWSDFEDAVVAAAAESSGCEVVVTRNVRDFRDSPVPAVTPEEYLSDLGE
jgi:predicted nucleic acid-binding protein